MNFKYLAKTYFRNLKFKSLFKQFYHVLSFLCHPSERIQYGIVSTH